MELDLAACWDHLSGASHGVLGTVHPERGVDAVPVVFVVDDDRVVIPIDTVKAKRGRSPAAAAQPRRRRSRRAARRPLRRRLVAALVGPRARSQPTKREPTAGSARAARRRRSRAYAAPGSVTSVIVPRRGRGHRLGGRPEASASARRWRSPASSTSVASTPVTLRPRRPDPAPRLHGGDRRRRALGLDRHRPVPLVAGEAGHAQAGGLALRRRPEEHALHPTPDAQAPSHPSDVLARSIHLARPSVTGGVSVSLLRSGRCRSTPTSRRRSCASCRTICMALPDAYEEEAWTGTRWRVAQAHLRPRAHRRGGPDAAPHAGVRCRRTDHARHVPVRRRGAGDAPQRRAPVLLRRLGARRRRHGARRRHRLGRGAPSSSPRASACSPPRSWWRWSTAPRADRGVGP